MKNLRNSICVLMMLLVAGNFAVMSQDLKKDKTETKAALKEKADKGKQLKKETKEEAQKADEIRKNYKRKMANASADERKELEEMMEKEIKDSRGIAVKDGADAAKRDLKGDMDKVKDQAKDEVQDAKSSLKDKSDASADEAKKVVKKKADGAYSDLKGRQLGEARATDAKKMIKMREKEMTDKSDYIKRSRSQIAAAKASLQSQSDDGSISAEEIAAKQARIDKAEERLSAYEARVEANKKKLSTHKNKLSDMYKN